MEGHFKPQSKHSHLSQGILDGWFVSSTAGGACVFIHAGKSEPPFDTTSLQGWAIWISPVCKVIGMESGGGKKLLAS